MMIALFGVFVFVAAFCGFSLVLAALAFLSRAWRRASFRRWRRRHGITRDWWQNLEGQEVNREIPN